ncbi:MAG: type II secretion system F family protein [Isosphaeraceae bacterium]|nr:type II secretion system F family protein [Isosphaeraceae bacterium]
MSQGVGGNLTQRDRRTDTGGWGGGSSAPVDGGAPPSTGPRPGSAGRSPLRRAGDAARSLFRRVFPTKVRTKHLAMFCRQFATYLDSGVSLNRTLESLHDQYRRTELGPILGRIITAVRRGESLTVAFANEDPAFDALFLSMIHLGEVRGGIPETLRMLSHQYEARLRLVRQARSALIYPTIVILIGIAVCGLFTIVVLPKLIAVLQDLVRVKKVVFPLPARILIQFTDFVRTTGWWALPLVFFGSVVLVTLAYRSTIGKAALDRIALLIPGIGGLLRKMDTTRFARGLAPLLDAGVDIGTSLELTAETLMLSPTQFVVARAFESVRQGGSLSDALVGARYFSTETIAFIKSGEETGKLPEMLTLLGDDYENQVEYIVKNIGNVIQPLILISMGGIVLFLVVAFFSAYLSVITTLSR